MGVEVKHVVVVAVVFAVVGFGYEIGFGEIDVVRSPRAGALGGSVGAGVGETVGKLRGYMVAGRGHSARHAGDLLIERWPQDPRAHLNRGYAYRMGGLDSVEDGFESWAMLGVIVGQRDVEALGGRALLDALYLRGWARRGLGMIDESRADFGRLALMTEANIGIEEGSAVVGYGGVGGVTAGTAYNLACYWAVAGDTERAMAYWEVAVAGGYLESEGIAGWWRVDPDLEDLWEDDRFWPPQPPKVKKTQEVVGG